MSQKDNVTPIRSEGITLRYKDTADKNLHAALEILDEFTGWTDAKDIHRFNKFKNTFDREQKKAGGWYKKLVMKHAETEPITAMSKITGKMEPQYDKNGKPRLKPIWKPNASGVMDIVMKDPDAFDADVKVFHGHEFTVKVYKFSADDLVKAGLTPLQLRACARIVEKADPELLVDNDDVAGEPLPDDLAGILGDEDDGTPDSDPTA